MYPNFSDLRQQIPGFEQQNPNAFRNAGGNTMPVRPYSFQLSLINSALTGSAILFGTNVDATETTNTAGNVTVSILELASNFPNNTHPTVKNNLRNQQLRIRGLKIIGSTEAQTQKAFSVTYKDLFGASQTRPVTPTSERTTRDFITTQIDMPNFELVVSPEVQINYDLYAGASATLIFSIVEVLDTSNLLSQDQVKQYLSQMRF